jgi:hypothetical protein
MPIPPAVAKYIVIEGKNKSEIQNEMNNARYADYKATLITVHPGTFDIYVIMELQH